MIRITYHREPDGTLFSRTDEWDTEAGAWWEIVPYNPNPYPGRGYDPNGPDTQVIETRSAA